MTTAYAQPDARVVDYQPYVLDPRVLDRATGQPLELRGPRPTLARGAYFACVGAAQTFGRFCARPYPTLLAERLGLDVLNLGRGGAGAAFFAQDNAALLPYLNRARFVIVQIMSARSESNALYRSDGLGHYTRRSDGARIACDAAYAALIARHSEDTVRAVVAQTRANWLESHRRLLRAIRVPKVLLWLSERPPAYHERWNDVYGLFGAYPQLVNARMVKALRGECDTYVEVVSRAGLPQALRDRRSGAPVQVHDPWGGSWTENWYYPSPEMHAGAAHELEEPCLQLVRTRSWRTPRAARALRALWHRCAAG